jgi:hypothetical protein
VVKQISFGCGYAGLCPQCFCGECKQYFALLNICELNEKPPHLRDLAYGLHWAFVAIPNAVIFSTFCAPALGLDPAGQIAFAQRLLITMGLMIIPQNLKVAPNACTYLYVTKLIDH